MTLEASVTVSAVKFDNADVEAFKLAPKSTVMTASSVVSMTFSLKITGSATLSVVIRQIDSCATDIVECSGNSIGARSYVQSVVAANVCHVNRSITCVISPVTVSASVIEPDQVPLDTEYETVSVPAPASTVSLPEPSVIVSLPPPAVMLLLPAVTEIVSAKSPVAKGRVTGSKSYCVTTITQGDRAITSSIGNSVFTIACGDCGITSRVCDRVITGACCHDVGAIAERNGVISVASGNGVNFLTTSDGRVASTNSNSVSAVASSYGVFTITRGDGIRKTCVVIVSSPAVPVISFVPSPTVATKADEPVVTVTPESASTAETVSDVPVNAEASTVVRGRVATAELSLKVTDRGLVTVTVELVIPSASKSVIVLPSTLESIRAVSY